MKDLCGRICTLKTGGKVRENSPPMPSPSCCCCCATCQPLRTCALVSKRSQTTTRATTYAHMGGEVVQNGSCELVCSGLVLALMMQCPDLVDSACCARHTRTCGETPGDFLGPLIVAFLTLVTGVYGGWEGRVCIRIPHIHRGLLLSKQSKAACKPSLSPPR